MSKSKVVYTGLRQRPTFEGIVDYLSYGQETLRYPNRFAKFIRNHPYLTQLDGDGMMEIQELQELAYIGEEKSRILRDILNGFSSGGGNARQSLATQTDTYLEDTPDALDISWWNEQPTTSAGPSRQQTTTPAGPSGQQTTTPTSLSGLPSDTTVTGQTLTQLLDDVMRVVNTPVAAFMPRTRLSSSQPTKGTSSSSQPAPGASSSSQPAPGASSSSGPAPGVASRSYTTTGTQVFDYDYWLKKNITRADILKQIFILSNKPVPSDDKLKKLAKQKSKKNLVDELEKLYSE